MNFLSSQVRGIYIHAEFCVESYIVYEYCGINDTNHWTYKIIFLVCVNITVFYFAVFAPEVHCEVHDFAFNFGELSLDDHHCGAVFGR